MNLFEISQIMANGSYYYIDKQVIVLRIMKELHLAKVRYEDIPNTFFIDISALSDTLSTERSISISLLRGDKL